MKGRVLYAGVTVLGLACGDVPTNVTEGTQPSAAIYDGANGGGNENFFFLPPMVSAPTPAGVFDGTLSPAVEICEWDGADCVDPAIAEFTLEDGPADETVRVVAEDEHYIVNWHTDRFEVAAGPIYRIRVLVDEFELGYADIQLAENGSELKNINTDEFIALKDGRTLPIKFRIEDGAVPVGLVGQVVDFAQHSLATTGSLVFFTDEGGVYEVDPANLSDVSLRTAGGPWGIVAVTANRSDNSILGTTALGELYSYVAADNWSTATLVGTIAGATGVVDLAQVPGDPGASVIAITSSGDVYEIDSAIPSTSVQLATAAVPGAVAITPNLFNASVVAATGNGHIYQAETSENWTIWRFKNSLGNSLTGVQDFVQEGSSAVDDFPVLRTVGGSLCWWDPRNHFSCSGSDLPGGVAAVAVNAFVNDVLVVSVDGTFYTRADFPTFSSWGVAGILVD